MSIKTDGTIVKDPVQEILTGDLSVLGGDLWILEKGTSPTYYTKIATGDQSGDVSYTLPTAQGGASTYLQNNGSGVLSWASVTVYAGTDTQVMFNDGGTALGGDAGLVYDKSGDILKIAGGIWIKETGATPTYFTKITAGDQSGDVAYVLPTAQAGGASYALLNTSGTLSWGAVAVVAGADTNIQYNDGGVFAGDANFTWAKTTYTQQIRQPATDAVGSFLIFLKSRSGTGAAGQDGDDIGTLSFKSYNDNATPELIEYAKVLAEIEDASDTTEDGKITLATMAAGTLDTNISIQHGILHIDNYHAGINDNAYAIGEGAGQLRIWGRSSLPAQVEYLSTSNSTTRGSLSFTDSVFRWVIWESAYSNAWSGGFQWKPAWDSNVALAFKRYGILDIGCDETHDYEHARRTFNIFAGTGPTHRNADIATMWTQDMGGIAGHAAFQFVGEENANQIAIGGGKIYYTNAPADHSASGDTHQGICGEALTLGDICYFKSDGKYYKADADAEATMPGVVLCLATTALPTGGATVSTIAASKTYTGTGLGTGFQVVGDIITFTGFSGAGSNGAKTVATIGTGTITVSEAIEADVTPYSASTATTQSTKTYAGTGIGTGVTAGDKLTFSGFTNVASNGVKTVDTPSANSLTVVEAIGADESGVAAAWTIAWAVTWTENDATCEFLSRGFFRDDSLYNLTKGGRIYVDTTTSGGIVQTAPSGLADCIQCIGYAYSADVIFFNPSMVISVV